MGLHIYHIGSRKDLVSPRTRLKPVVDLKHGVAIASGAQIDLSTPTRKERDEDISLNTAETTPNSVSSSSAKRRNREMRLRQLAKAQVDKNQTEVNEENKAKSPKKASKKPQTARVSTAIDNISKILIKIYYETVPGQDLYILGEDPKFGAWDTNKLGLPLKWTEGHMWTAEVTPKSLPKQSVFKFIVSEKDGSITWETREDRVFDISKVTYALRTSHRLKSKGNISLEKGSVTMELDEGQSLVTLTYKWDL